MKMSVYRKYYLIIISLALVSIHIQAQNLWTIKTHLPTPRACPTASVVDGKIYVIGGSGFGLVDMADNEMYDPSTGTWDTTLTPVPTPRGFPTSEVVDGIIYVIGGGYPVATTKIEAYDPSTNTWDTTLTDMPGGPRMGMRAGVVNGIIYVAAGNYNENDFFSYDPATDTWDTLDPVPEGGGALSVTAYNGLIYTFGGSMPSWMPLSYVFAYDPQTGNWNTTLTHMPTPRHCLYTYLIGDTIYAVGGSQSYGTALPTVETYYPLNDTWGEPKPDMQNPYCLFAGAVINNEVYAIAGTSDWVSTDNAVWENEAIWVVPVELTSFTVSSNGKEVILNWSTATELNNRGFEIQRSTEGVDFLTVGFVNGHGTTTEQHNYSYADKNLNNGKYYYRLKQVDFNGSYECSDVVEIEWRAFNSYLLEQNFPNPFNPKTRIGFGIQDKSNVKITVLSVIGEELAVILNEEKEPGYYQIEFNALSISSGVYFYRIKAGDFVQTKKMILLR